MLRVQFLGILAILVNYTLLEPTGRFFSLLVVAAEEALVQLGLRDPPDLRGQRGLLTVRLTVWLRVCLSALAVTLWKEPVFGSLNQSWQYFRERGPLVLDTLRERVELDLRGPPDLRDQRGLLTVKLTVWLHVCSLAPAAIL